MCGIVGRCSFNSIINQETLIAQRDALRHRGPDDKGIWCSNDSRVGLAHRRLSIIDTSSSGHQPMQNDTGEYCITFNGEIYNFKDLRKELKSRGHSFKSNSDTEVILASYIEWGESCLERFNGMFAFGIYDNKKRKLFIARDRAGEKPLFYIIKNKEIIFASTLKALFADDSIDRHLDHESFQCYLAYGYVPGNMCIIEGINKLPPAHALTFDIDTGFSKIWEYWNLPEPPNSNDRNFIDESILMDELENLLEESVAKQLVADVPVGILLSGGLDSSIITAMAARSKNSFKTFTISFPGYKEYDETEHARLIARHFGTEHIELEATSSLINLLPKLARQFDEPIVDSSMIPTYLVSKLVRKHCTVALGGDGGDELFGGYKHYSRLLWLQRRMKYFPKIIRSFIGRSAESILPYGFKGRYWLQALDTDFKTELPFISKFFSQKEMNELLHPSSKGIKGINNDINNLWSKRKPLTTSLLQRATRFDFKNYLAEDVLVKLDRASMLNS